MRNFLPNHCRPVGVGSTPGKRSSVGAKISRPEQVKRSSGVLVRGVVSMFESSTQVIG